MRNKLLAVLAAVAMVFGAVAVRARLDDGGGATAARPEEEGTVCDAALRACRGVSVIAPTQIVDDFLVDTGPPGVDRWVTIGPWPAMVDAGRRAAGRDALFTQTRSVASTGLVAVVLRSPPQCTGDVTWKCLGEAAHAGERIAAPSGETTVRLAIRAAMLGSHLGRTDFASNDFVDDPAAADWLAGADRNIDAARQFGATSLGAFLATRVSADVFLTTAAEAAAAGVPLSQAQTPTPPTRLTVDVGSVDTPRSTAALEARLLSDRWTVPAEPGLGLPSPGVLLALREVGS